MCQRNKKDIFISGASGFIGQNLVPFFLEKKFNITVLARNRKKLKKFKWFQKVKFQKIDLNDKKTWNLKILKSSSLIHLAWQGLPNYENNFHLKNNLKSNYEFIKYMIKKGITDILITGTCLEYGKLKGKLYSNQKTFPEIPYAKAKDILRKKIQNLTNKKKLSFKWARLFYIFGKGQNKSSLIPDLENTIKQKKKTFKMSRGDQIRDYLPVEKVVEQLFELFKKKENGIFNICSGVPIKVKHLVKDYLNKKKKKIKLNLGFYPYPKYEAISFWGNRDIGEKIYLPSTPNAPLKNKRYDQALAPVRLRYNKSLKFLENDAFEEKMINYNSDYDNSQSFSQEFRKHMLKVFNIIKRNLHKDSKVVEVGCGQGHFIDLITKKSNHEVKGFDTTYRGKNKKIEKRYLTKKDVISADMIVLRHVLEHIPKPYEFLLLLKSIFKKSKIYIEVPEYNWIKKKKAFFDITYEHVNYFTQTSLGKLFKKKKEQGLLFNKQYQYIIANIEDLSKSFKRDYYSYNWEYKSFENLFPDIIKKMNKMKKVAKDNSIYIWGAGTKGCLFLNYCKNRNILIDNIKFAIDINPNKIGKYLPGSLIQIKSKEFFLKRIKNNDTLLISNPNYKKEIIEEIKKNSSVKFNVFTI
tara:strand:- start:11342 stop:13249 length:1908 start_codon:yes stop_codon:yes gene_type:complete